MQNNLGSTYDLLDRWSDLGENPVDSEGTWGMGGSGGEPVCTKQNRIK